MLPSFLSPWLLLGMLAISIPILLHFFYRVRYRKLPWAAMQFLRLSIEQTSRRLRFQELILLTLRCVALLLLALALARPTWNAISGNGRGESIDAVFVFDTSYSMGASDGEATRFERAKTAALTILDNLPANSTVQIFSATDRVSFLGPVTPGNLDQARQVIDAMALSSLSGDILPGLTEAENALDRGVGSNKEVYVFGDLQKTGWDRQAAAIRAKANEIQQRAAFIVVRCGNPQKALTNVALVDMTYPGGIPHTGSRLPVSVLVKNTGKLPAKNLTVTLEIEGAANEKETATLEQLAPGESTPVTLTVKLDRAGAQRLTATLQSDDLPGDNRLDRLIPVRESIRVLVVDGMYDPRDSKQSASHFVTNALLPVPVDQQAEYHVRVTLVPPEEAGAGLLAASDICILCNVAATSNDRPGIAGLPTDFIGRLPSFVAAGGSLLIGSGDNVSGPGYNLALGSGGAKLLPFDLGEAQSAEVEQPFKPAPDSTDHPSFLSRFREEPFSTVTGEVEVRKYLAMSEKSASGGRVLMRLANQKPWLAQRVVGEGEVLFVATSLDASWTNWPAKAGAYLSFLQLSLSHLSGKATQNFQRTAGENLTWNPPEATTAWELVKPDRSRVKLPPPTGEKLTLTATDTAVAGLYRFAVAGEEIPTGPLFAVTPDLRESENLESLTDAEAEELLGFKPVLLMAGPNAATELVGERSKREWTVWVLFGLFLVALGEAFWAWFCGKAW
jgi:Aerotolerance regulator N-terminal/von Willebrand factor type A domain/CARDB